MALIYQYYKKDYRKARKHYLDFLKLNPDKTTQSIVALKIAELDRLEGISKVRSWFKALLSFLANIFSWVPKGH